jgi:hypothetical protein
MPDTKASSRFGLEHLSGVGFNHEQRFGLRDLDVANASAATARIRFNGRLRSNGQENTRFRSGPLRPAFDEEVVKM